MKKLFCVFITFFSVIYAFCQAPLVQDIQSSSGKGTKINLYWTLPKTTDKPIQKFCIYRSTQQITSYSQIELLSPIAEISPESTGYTDTVTDFKDYFYCVIAVTDKPFDLVLLSFNSTLKGTHIAYKTDTKEPVKITNEKLYPAGTLRETPLPYIDIVDGLNENEIISQKTVNQTNSLSTITKKKNPLLKQYIFEEDLVSPDSGDDVFLFEILKTTFVQKKYKEAIVQLNKLIGTNIADSTRNKARFYLGEAEYFLGNYENAVRIFVQIESEFPSLAKKWLDSSLDRI